MSFLQNKNLGAIAIVGLLVVNSVLLVLLLKKPELPPPPPRPHGEEMPPPPGEGPRRFMEHEIGFSDEQSPQFGKLIEDHQLATRKLRDSIRVQREKLSDLLKSDSADRKKAEVIAGAIGQTQAQLELVNFDHFTEVRKICTEEQKPKFDSVIEQATRALGPEGPPPGDRPMGPPPGGPHHGGPPHPPGPRGEGPPPHGGPPHPPGPMDGGPGMPPPPPMNGGPR